MKVLALPLLALSMLMFPGASMAQDEEKAYFCISAPAFVVSQCDGVDMPKETCDALFLFSYLNSGETFQFLPATECGPGGEGVDVNLTTDSLPPPDTTPTETVTQPVDDLQVGDSFKTWGYSEDEYTTVTLEAVEFGIPTSRYSKPDKGMTTMALFFTFEAGPGGGTTNYVQVYGPDGAAFDRFYGAEGKYAKDWGYADIRPGSQVKGWTVYEVPDRGTVEVVMSGLDEYGEETFATWVVEH